MQFSDSMIMLLLIFFAVLICAAVVVGCVYRWCARIRIDLQKSKLDLQLGISTNIQQSTEELQRGIAALRKPKNNMPPGDDDKYLDRSDVTAEVIMDHSNSDGF